MKTIFATALAVSAAVAVIASDSVEAKCVRGHHFGCGYYRALHSHKAAYRSLAAGYGSVYPYSGPGYGYYGSGSSSAAEMGPAPRSGGGS